MEVSRERDQRDVDRGEVVGEPAREVDVCDRAVLGADPLREMSEQAAEPVGGEYQSLCSDYSRGDRRTANRTAF